MKKHWKIYALILLILAVCIFVQSFFVNQKAQRMLDAVGLGSRSDLRRVSSIVLNGPRFEKDGFEYMVFSNKSNDRKLREERTPWSPPELWTIENIDVMALGERLSIDIDMNAIISESMGGVYCSAWFLHIPEHVKSGSDKPEYFLGYYDSSEDAVFICHGYIISANKEGAIAYITSLENKEMYNYIY